MNLALLISGSGTTADAVINACQTGELTDIYPGIVISSRQNTTGLQKAEKRGIPTAVITPRSYNTPQAFGEALLSVLNKYHTDIVSQNGWLPLTPQNVIDAFANRIINQHPGPLDPGREHDLGGKGMYGARVVCARIAYLWFVCRDNYSLPAGEAGIVPTESWTEATTHFVTKKFDKGDLIRTERVRFDNICTKFVGNGRDRSLQNINTQSLITATHELQQRLLTVEHHNVIETLRQFSQGNVVGYKREKELIPKKHIDSLKKAKKIAIELFPKG